MWSWVVWAIMLLVQNASFTWVSRARNSSSIRYHALAALCSNGVWFIALTVAVDKIAEVRQSQSLLAFAATALFYTVFTVLGSVGSHAFLMSKVERRVTP